MAKKDAQKYIQMIQDETDPDKIQILELDIQRELGLDPEDLKDDVIKKIKSSCKRLWHICKNIWR